MKKRILFNRSYRNYFRGDFATFGAAEADNLVRQGYAKPAPLEEDASGADDKGDEGEAASVETAAPSPPDNLSLLREEAKEAGISNYWLMKEDTLLEKLRGADEEE